LPTFERRAVVRPGLARASLAAVATGRTRRSRYTWRQVHRGAGDSPRGPRTIPAA